MSFGLVSFIIVVVIVVFVWGLTLDERGDSVAGDLGEKLGLSPGAPFVIELHGRTFSVARVQAGKGTVTTMRITTAVAETPGAPPTGDRRDLSRDHLACRPAIVLRRETTPDRRAKRQGKLHEIQTGDGAFDAAAFIESDDPEDAVRRTLADARVRDAVRVLLMECWVEQVELGPEGLTVEMPKHEPTPSEFEKATGQMAAIVDALPLFTAGVASKARSTKSWLKWSMATAMLALAVLNLGGPPPLRSAAALPGGGGGLILWAIFAAVAVTILRGRSDSPQRIAYVLLPTLLLFPFAGHAGLVVVNRALDASAPVAHQTTIVRKWPTRTPFLDVASWQSGEPALSILVTRDFVSKATVGAAIVVTTRAGGLGWEWVESYRLANE